MIKHVQPGTIAGTLGGVLLLLAAGLIAGRPALQGTYLSGDDEQLILNHALVNHPSIEHAVKLFRIVHRDLYQPLPLLTFQIEFAVHGGSLRLLHLTNVLLHVLNGVLVWRLFGRRWGLLAGLLHVCHPLGAECLAWLNGRMILMSTAFTLIALMLFDRWSERLWRRDSESGSAVPGWLSAVGVLVAAVAAMISKAWMALPVLLLLLPVWRGYRPDRRWWMLWSVVALITGGFVWLNIGATEATRMFEGAEKQLDGPPLARMVLALGWYLIHYFWPVGLSPYYAPPRTVAWSDTGVLVGLGVGVLAVLAAVLSRRHTRAGILGLAWFGVAIAPGLFMVLARNLMVADRYTYLANIGLHAVVAGAWYAWFRRGRGPVGRAVAVASALIVLLGWTGHTRQVSRAYANNQAKIERVLQRFPDHPTLRTTRGWFLFEEQDYAGARQMADEELQRFEDDRVARYRALNLRAMSRYYGESDVAGAEQDLRAAIDCDPDFAKSYYRLGLIYFEQGRFDEAVTQLQQAADKAPQFNPALNLLARIHRRLGRTQQARQLYEQAVTSARGYDVEAINALGELDIESGNYQMAVQRYDALLKWHPQDVRARLNLALAWRLLERPGEAAAEYQWLISRHPQDRRVLIAASDYLRSAGRYPQALSLWQQALAAESAAPDVLAWVALHQWFNGDDTSARRTAEAALAVASSQPVAELALLLCDVRAQHGPQIMERCERFRDLHVGLGMPLSGYALEALELCSQLDPDSPWPYYVTAVVLLAGDRVELAHGFRQGFESRCSEPDWRRRLDEIFRRHSRQEQP